MSGSKTLLFVVGLWLSGCSDAATRVVAEIEPPEDSEGFVRWSNRVGYSHPGDVDVFDSFLENPSSGPRRIEFQSHSKESDSRLGVYVRGYEWGESRSEAESFWGAYPETEVARVGLQTSFVPWETRYVRLVPTYGCLQSLDSVPVYDPESLGHEGNPLVIDGCSDDSDPPDDDEGSITDAGVDEDGGGA